MEDSKKSREIAESVRKAEGAKGRNYSAQDVEPQWLASEIVEHCRMHGWKNTLHDLPGGNAWLLVTSDNIAVLVEKKGGEVVVKAMDLYPVRMKTCLTINSLLALTGAFIPAAALTGAAAWRSQARNAKTDSLLKFIDERVQSRTVTTRALPSAPSVADRMRDLGVLRDQGLITNEEYEAKRKELLEAI
jgi:hypothetical protein